MSLNSQGFRTIVPLLIAILAWPTEPALAIREAAIEAAPAVAALKAGRVPRPMRLRTLKGEQDQAHFDHDIIDENEDEPRALPVLIGPAQQVWVVMETLIAVSHTSLPTLWAVPDGMIPLRLRC